MKHISIKWKLTLSFVILGIVLVGTYVFMATSTFESDKISYVFDSEQTQIEGISKQIEQRIERIIFDSRSILAGFDVANKKLNTIAAKLFDEQNDISAIQLIDMEQKDSLAFLVKKDAESMTDLNNTNDLDIGETHIKIRGLKNNYFQIITSQRDSDGSVVVVKVLAKLNDLLPRSQSAHYLLSQEGQILTEDRSLNGNLISIVPEVVEEISRDRSQKTQFKEVGNVKLLVSSAPLRYGNLRLTSIVDQNEALGALNILYNRSLIFVLFSMFATLIFSLLLSSGLTKSLQKLTAIAEKISQGDFSSTVTSASNDEVGTLSKAFSKMNQEIERLLIETKDKARMESELKTTALVQESLFPKVTHYMAGSIDINGIIVNSTECGGDWWYYFERGHSFYLVIADATGHGTPAALITCAARALFSQFERSNIGLEEMMRNWDVCVAECSNQKVMMTGLIVEINKLTGQVKFVNASHEFPLLITGPEGGELSCDPILLPVGPRLGEKKAYEWKIHEYQLKTNDRLVIYTDGLTAIANSAGKEFGEKRMVKALAKISKDNTNSLDLTEKFYSLFENHRAGTPLPDDVTLVVFEWGRQVALQKDKVA
ncbi:MAG: PP2C family protein-serine/threonine phosphatase [Bdellovibrio sp.]